MPKIKDFPDTGVVYAFSIRSDGNMSLRYGNTENSLNNRKNFLGGLGINYKDLICVQQIHGNQTRYATGKDKARGALTYESAIADTDALVTDRKNLPLAVFTADCLPIFLYDPQTPAIGLVHAGWRSTQENIVTVAIQLMQEEFNTRVKDLCVGFAPAIRECCYEVEEDFKKFFLIGISERNSRYYLDLIRINKKQILDLGLKENNIFDSGICTVCNNKDYFSYRKENEASGRMMSVMMLR
ncbi:MAG: hypothetical protein A2166_04005 [Omnitrophica WOR_2 bacterium RBG_13_41_10]|nr:MAG: hypothetical protein A2166_04005 [Omnitrophica WOR_2 bacterium RBG_13_41_10]